MKGWIKSHTSDRYLSPIYTQMIARIERGENVCDVGCGTGQFLIELAPLISFGHGIDTERSIISHAQKSAQKHNLSNISFEVGNVLDIRPEKRFHTITACMFFHVLPNKLAIEALKQMLKASDRLIVCGFSQPQTATQKFLMHIDQCFNNHYKHFKAYTQNGYMEGLIKKSQLHLHDIADTFDPVLKIYTITN